eukprot:jgi/Ulvmu1/12148/UM085_0012.1
MAAGGRLAPLSIPARSSYAQVSNRNFNGASGFPIFISAGRFTVRLVWKGGTMQELLHQLVHLFHAQQASAFMSHTAPDMGLYIVKPIVLPTSPSNVDSAQHILLGPEQLYGGCVVEVCRSACS